MGIFKYQASKADGSIHAGSIEADSLRMARNLLREQDLWVLKLNLVQTPSGKYEFLPKRRWGAARLAYLTRQLPN